LALYAIGDLHLSLGSDKPMDVFGGGWNNYIDKIRAGFQMLGPEDICVLCGDTSWGMSLEESLEDFKFIEKLPGRKIMLKGNHDYWWETVTKMKGFFEKNGIESIDFLHNNSFFYEGAAICGSRGWMIDAETQVEHNVKIMARETARLKASLMTAGDAAEKLCFLHYPPRIKNHAFQDVIEVMNEHGVKNCWYGHLHGTGHRSAICGVVDGIDYKMISADYIDFTPQLIM